MIKKKILALLLMAAMLLTLFGCTSVPGDGAGTSAPTDAAAPAGSETPDAAAPAEKQQLRFMSGLWDGTREAVHKAIKAGAEEQFPDVAVEYEMTGTSGDWLNKLKTYNATGDMPDVFFMAASVTFPIINAGNVVDLMPYVKEDGFFDRTYANDVEAGVNDDGTLYALPEGLDYYFNPCIFYNTQIFTDAGISELPKTWDEFLTACETLKGKGLIPLAMCDKDSSSLTYWFSQMMIMLDDPKTVEDLMANKTDWSQPAVIRGFDRITELVRKGYFPEDITSLDYGAAMELFSSGQAAMYLQMSWDIGAFADRDDVGIMPWPQLNPDVNPADYTITWCAPNSGYAVWSKTKHLDTAVKFAEMCAFQAAYGAESEMGQPSSIDTGVDVEAKMSALAKANMDAFIAAPNKLRPYGNYWFSSKMFSEFAKLGSQLLTGQYTGEQFAQDIAPTWATNFEDMKQG